MPLKRVTMQDIADACGLSRNTVSKIFNGRGSVPEATKKLVLVKARELGYSQQPQGAEQPNASVKGQIALLAQSKLQSHSFGAHFTTSFTDQISRTGYALKIYEVSPEEIAEKRLPPQLDLSETAGILGIELFDQAYLDMICAQKKPTVFVDGPAYINQAVMACDFVSMENIASERVLVRRMLRAGARRVGFVGDIEHCNSFFERWIGFNIALKNEGLSVNRSFCILAEDSAGYGDTEWLIRQLSAMPQLPDALACANDYLAIHLMTALKHMGMSIPSDVMVAGFDGSLEATLCDPALTTAQIPSPEIGRLAASLLAERIVSPNAPFRWTYVQTTPVLGGSTR